MVFRCKIRQIIIYGNIIFLFFQPNLNFALPKVAISHYEIL